MSKDNGRGLKSLAELAATGLADGCSLDLPDLGSLDDAAMEEIRRQAQKDQKVAKEAGEWLAAALPMLEKIQYEERGVREMASPRVRAFGEAIEKLLTHESVACRRVAWITLFTHEFSRPIDSVAQGEALLGRLVMEKRLTRDPNGGIQFGKERYSIPALACFSEGQPEMAQFNQAVSGLRSRLGKLREKDREERARDLLARGNLSCADVLAGKSGFWAAVVPDQVVVEQDGNLVQEGGVIFTEVRGGAVYPIEAAAHFQISPVCAEDKGVIGIEASSLAADKFRFTGFVADPSQVKVLRFAWDRLSRAVRWEQDKERILAFETISELEFFLEQKPGLCRIAVRGWEVKDREDNVTGRIGEMLLVVERIVCGETKKIRIAYVPNSLSKFFASCMGEYLENEKFHGLPYPLKAVLQSAFGEMDKTNSINAIEVGAAR